MLWAYITSYLNAKWKVIYYSYRKCKFDLVCDKLNLISLPMLKNYLAACTLFWITSPLGSLT